MSDSALATMLQYGSPFLMPGQGELCRSPFGVCDPDFRGQRNAGVGFRFATGFVSGVAVPGAGITFAPFALEIFNYGQGDLLTGQGFTTAVATPTETNLQDEGAPVKLGEKFITTSIGVELMRPFTSTGAQNKLYDEWLSAWRSRLYEILAENLTLSFQFGDDACDYDLGTLAMWPRCVSGKGGDLVGGSAGIGIANMMPFRRPFEMGARDNTDQLTLTITNSWTIVAGADPVVPIPAEVTLVRFPIQVILYGYPICCPVIADTGATADAMIVRAEQDPAYAARLRRILAGG